MSGTQYSETELAERLARLYHELARFSVPPTACRHLCDTYMSILTFGDTFVIGNQWADLFDVDGEDEEDA